MKKEEEEAAANLTDHDAVHLDFGNWELVMNNASASQLGRVLSRLQRSSTPSCCRLNASKLFRLVGDRGCG